MNTLKSLWSKLPGFVQLVLTIGTMYMVGQMVKQPSYRPPLFSQPGPIATPVINPDPTPVYSPTAPATPMNTPEMVPEPTRIDTLPPDVTAHFNDSTNALMVEVAVISSPDTCAWDPDNYSIIRMPGVWAVSLYCDHGKEQPIVFPDETRTCPAFHLHFVDGTGQSIHTRCLEGQPDQNDTVVEFSVENGQLHKTVLTLREVKLP